VLVLLVAPFVAQAAATFVDERVYHRRRGLPRWERIGHPLDTLTVLACYAWLFAARPSSEHALAYAALGVFSCLFVTKDEYVHAKRCLAGEHWIHALLFLLHPIVFITAGYLWWTGRLRPVIVAELVLTTIYATYQFLYWNGPWRRAPVTP
jgi:hypothetical protein